MSHEMNFKNGDEAILVRTNPPAPDTRIQILDLGCNEDHTFLKCRTLVSGEFSETLYLEKTTGSLSWSLKESTDRAKPNPGVSIGAKQEFLDALAEIEQARVMPGQPGTSNIDELVRLQTEVQRCHERIDFLLEHNNQLTLKLRVPPEAMEKPFEFGATVRDRITFFFGYVIGYCEYISGCNQVLVQPACKDNGDFVESRWMDVDRMERLPITPVKLIVETPGFDKPAPRK